MSKQNPIRRGAVITPSNSDVFPRNTYRGFYVGGDGDIFVDLEDGGVNISFIGVKQGLYYPFAITRVYATGTTATDIRGLA